MIVRDHLGLALSGADATSAAHYDAALTQLRCYVGDPVASVDAAIAERPGFTMAHLLKAYLHLLGTEPAKMAAGRAAYRAATRLPAAGRELGHLKAVGLLAEGRWHEAGRTLEDVTVEEPRDVLALQVGHLIDYFTGNCRMLRDRIARALPAWDARMPAYHAVLGMHAFGLEETGDYARAETAGKRAVDLEPRDGWAHHAVAHVMEMQGRAREGIEWMQDHADRWSADSFFKVHNWWHLALYHLELGEVDEVIALYDQSICPARSRAVLDIVDATALLWRLRLRGVDLDGRWEALADDWASVAVPGIHAFNDLHLVMALVGAGRWGTARDVIAVQEGATHVPGDNAALAREVGVSASRAVLAFGEGDYAGAVALLRQLRPVAHRFGGSHAQRDVLDLTLIEAAILSGRSALAAALAAERANLKPESPLTRMFAERARVLPTAA